MATATKFTPEHRGILLERIAAGLSFQDACRAADVSYPSLKNWLKRGRKEESGDHADFAAAVDKARQAAADREPPMDLDELKVVVATAARKGSVAAMKLRWEMSLADRSPAETEEEAPKPLGNVDELAQRRAA